MGEAAQLNVVEVESIIYREISEDATPLVEDTIFPDYVLMKSDTHPDCEEQNEVFRNTFIENLRSGREYGLHIETKDENIGGKNQTFYLISASDELLKYYAEVLQIKLPIHREDKKISGLKNMFVGRQLQFTDPFPEGHPYRKFFRDGTKLSEYITAPYQRQFHTEFHHDNLWLNRIDRDRKDTIFPQAIRIRIILYLLKTTKYGFRISDVGIDRLIQSACFEDAFPLHDGSMDEDVFSFKLAGPENGFNPNIEEKKYSLRRLLRCSWANTSCAFCIQPLEQILFYFGEKTAIYFAWLGFYTQMLVLPAIIGLCVFFRGLVGFGGFGWVEDSPVGVEMCNDTRLLCPRCDGPAKSCQFVEIRDSCTFVKFTSLFDNTWTVYYALFMAVWAQVFCELWKRREQYLTDNWNLQDEPGDGIRIDYEKRAKDMQQKPSKLDKILNKPFPIKVVNGSCEVPYVRKMPYIFLSISIICMLGAIAIGSVIGVTLFRLTLSRVLSGLDTHDLLTDNAVLISSALSVLINFACIQLLNEAFGFCAKTLTSWELPKTDGEFEKSYTLKMFIFQAVNFWSSIFYIAFIKGRGTGTPIEYTRFGGTGSFRLEECHPSGCLFDLSMQLAIIMILKQAVGNVVEIGIPFFKGYLRKKGETGFAGKPWKRDACLEQNDRFYLFDEYLEMAIQFGFCTIFVASFPLAPLMAFFNNIIEIRLDAYKFINLKRRVPVEMSKSIGAWGQILDVIAAIALLTNALVAGVTSDMIPKFVYATAYGPCAGESIFKFGRVNRRECMHGYSDWSLQSVHVADLDYGSYGTLNGTKTTLYDLYHSKQSLKREKAFKLENLVKHQTYLDYEQLKLCLTKGSAENDKNCQCYYRGYSTTDEYFVMAARLLFIIMFQNVVLLLRWIFMRCLPGMDDYLEERNVKKEQKRLQQFYKIEQLKVQ